MDFLFPKRCIICNKLIELGKELCFCNKCLGELNSYEHIYEMQPKGECLRVLSGVRYEGYIRNYMIDYKFRGVKILGKSYAYIVQKIWERAFQKQSMDKFIVICVPMHMFRRRDYNQSKVIAELFSKSAHLTADFDILVKKRGIKQLSSMTKAEKAIFVKDAFEVINSWRLNGKTVILIDDIYTTGETTGECAKLLLNNGAEGVIVITPCYTPEI